MPSVSCIEAIRNIVNRDIVQTESPICLKEADPGSECRPIIITKSGPAVVLKVDGAIQDCPKADCPIRLAGNARMFPMLNTGEPGVTAICDYIIFHQEGRGDVTTSVPLHVLLCELKSGRAREAKRQIENGKLLADYILRMAEHHGRLGRSAEVSYKGLVFSPRFQGPKGDPRRNPCQFARIEDSMADVQFAYLRDGLRYPLEYFCG